MVAYTCTYTIGHLTLNTDYEYVRNWVEKINIHNHPYLIVKVFFSFQKCVPQSKYVIKFSFMLNEHRIAGEAPLQPLRIALRP